MPHDTPLISTIVAGLVLAFVFGAIANRLRMPPLVGYLIAGVLVGPNTPGFVADAELANELSEIGVILLMFGVGLHFSLKDLLSVRAIAIPGAAVQIGGATIMGLGLGLLLGWSVGGGLMFGLALSVASTVVLLRAMQDRHLLDSERGRIAVGWLIVEDIAMVLALVLIPTLAPVLGGTEIELHDPFIDFVERAINAELGLLGILAVTVVKLAAFVGFMLVVGRRVIPYALHFTAHTGSRELFRLAVLAIALGVAAGSSYLFGVSLALGAFFAGMILSESELSHRAAQETLPLRDAFAVLFFVAVGMLFDPSIVWEQPLLVVGTLFIILVGKSILAFLIVLAFRRPVATALTISASLAQIGEFSFILATLGVGLGIMLPEARDLILAGSIISILLNPVAFMASDALRPWLEGRFGRPGEAPEMAVAGGGPAAPLPAEEEEAVAHPTALTAHTVVIGYGRVGSVLSEGLMKARRPFLVIEDSDGPVKAARGAGIEVIEGNAASGQPLHLANVAGAATVVVAIPNAFEAGQAVEQTRKANPSAFIIARAHSDEEEAHLYNLGASKVIMGEREIGLAMFDLVQHGRSQMAARSGLEAVEAAIVPKDAVPRRKLPREPERTLTGIDEVELAKAIGVPVVEAPASAEAAQSGSSMVSETVVDVDEGAITETREPLPADEVTTDAAAAHREPTAEELLPAPDEPGPAAGPQSIPDEAQPKIKRPSTRPAEPFALADSAGPAEAAETIAAGDEAAAEKNV